MNRPLLLFTLLMSLCALPAFGQVSPPVLKVEDGGTGANNAAAARLNLGAAAAGANSDITSLSGLTTVLPTSEGGTGSTGGVSPTGSLKTTPETVINIADFGGCTGSIASDTATLNSALAAARASTAYLSNQPVRVVGGFGANGVACSVTQVNATGFTRFGGGARLLIEDLTLSCSGSGNICLDALGSLNIQFNKVTIVGSASSPPMIGLQEGNVAPATIACCIHTHYGLEITGSFSFAGLYSAASESTTYYSPIVRNNGASLGVVGALGPISGGSGYTNGAYTGVVLSGSPTGAGAIANVIVSGGAVTSVTLTNQGKQYAIGDSLTAAGSTLGAGSGFRVSVTNIGQFAMVMDGQNHWGVSSSFQSVNWPADTYYTFTENNIIGGSLRYYGSAYQGAPLWIGSVEGLRTVHMYLAQLATGPCVSMFDNNATFTLHNINETLEIECESSAATSDVQLTGSNPTPNVSGLTIVDPLSTVSTAILSVDAGITAVTAHNSNISVGYTTAKPSLFTIGAANLWTLDGAVSLPSAWQFNAPASTLVSGISAGVPTNGGGPLDMLNSTFNVSAAYSCARRLSYGYKGPLCNIRRASDSAAIDLYSNSVGATDKSALTAFCANTSCFITMEYDQSGNSNNAANATSATQPQIVIEGSNLNFATCGVWGNGGNANLTVTSNSAMNGLFATSGFASAVTSRTAAISNSMRLMSKVAGGTGWELSGSYALGYGFPQFTMDASGTVGAWVSSTLMPTSGGHIFDVAYNYASLSNLPALGVDGGAQSYQSSTQPSGAIVDANNLIIGNSAAGGFGWPGDICEVILARQALSPVQIDAIRRNQAAFYNLNNVL
ncbi:MAG: hypothetical protein KGM15_11305 [Pseudomonadota bacterium]|nr:hypothetical protein [Pseudomonadota bacterium]